MVDYIERYSKDIGIDIKDKIEKGLEKPKIEFEPILIIPPLNSALGELYKYEMNNVLKNKEGIINKIRGDSINFFGAITELYFGGLFAPKIIKHSSPDYILSLKNREISIEITNSIPDRDEIKTSSEWGKVHRSYWDKIYKKKAQNPNFLFICSLERAYERLERPIITNIPLSGQYRIRTTPKNYILQLLDNEMQGIFSYDINPLHLLGEESGIIKTDLALEFIEFLKQRYQEIFSYMGAIDALYALEKIQEQAGSLND